MCKNADETFLLRETVLDHLVADQECLDRRCGDLSHVPYSRERSMNGKQFSLFGGGEASALYHEADKAERRKT